MIAPPYRPIGIWAQIVALGCAFGASADALSAPNEQAKTLADELFVASVDRSSAACAGGYIQPQRAFNLASDDKLRVFSDELTGALDKRMVLSGAVEIQQRDFFISAPAVDINAASTISFNQGLRLEQPHMVMRGRQAQWQTDQQQLQIETAELVIAESGLRAQAQRLSRNAAGQLTIDDGEFTYCPPGDDGWSLSAQQLTVAASAEHVITRGALLRIKSVPVLYLPYLKMPLGGGDESTRVRQSGFLLPSVGYGDEDGASFGVPYYLNIAPNLDATVKPKWVGNRGAGFAAQGRWLTSQQRTQIQAGLLPDDKIYSGIMSRRRYDRFGGVDRFGTFIPADRWYVNLRHSGAVGRLRTYADYSRLSDRDYLRDLSMDFDLSRNSTFDSTNPADLQRRIEVHYQHNGLTARLWHQSFQRLDHLALPTYSRSPQLDLDYQRAIGAHWRLRTLGSWARFEQIADDFFAPLGVSQQDLTLGVYGERWHVQPELSYLKRWPAGFVAGAGGFKYTAYALEQDLQSRLFESSPTRGVGYFNVDAGLYFDRYFQGMGKRWLQTLEPRTLYLRQGYADQSALPLFDTTDMTLSYSQLFRKERFVGLDRVGDANQLTVGISSRLLSAENGQEYASYSLGKIVYARNPRVGLRSHLASSQTAPGSILVSEFNLRFGSRWQLDSQQIWSQRADQWQELGAALHYRLNQRRMITLGARKRLASAEFLDQAVEQVEVSTIWPASRRVSLMARWHYDVQRSRTVEGFVGLQYDDCCVRGRLLLTQALRSSAYLPLSVAGSADYSLRTNRGVALEVTLKGLGGFGSNIDALLRRGVRGYDNVNVRP